MRILVMFGLLLFLFGCSGATISSTNGFLPKQSRVALVAFDNYTDTSQAGFRAANLLEGILLSRGFVVLNLLKENTGNLSLTEKIKIAKKYKADYLITGGVSEWRYKAGIDVQPAISLSIKAIDLDSYGIIWSSTGSDQGGNSIGTAAQSLMNAMINR